jgi:hypothetical protein
MTVVTAVTPFIEQGLLETTAGIADGRAHLGLLIVTNRARDATIEIATTAVASPHLLPTSTATCRAKMGEPA